MTCCIELVIISSLDVLIIFLWISFLNFVNDFCWFFSHTLIFSIYLTYSSLLIPLDLLCCSYCYFSWMLNLFLISYFLWNFPLKANHFTGNSVLLCLDLSWCVFLDWECWKEPASWDAFPKTPGFTLHHNCFPSIKLVWRWKSFKI